MTSIPSSTSGAAGTTASAVETVPTPAAKSGASAGPGPLRKAHWSTIVLGVLGLIVLCPLIQYLELTSPEKYTFSAVALPPFAIVAICGTVLAALLAGLVKRLRPEADFVLIYAMFMVGTTVCASGLVRPIYTHMTAILDEVVNRKVDTPRGGYARQDPRFFPKLSTPLFPPIVPDPARREEQAAQERARDKQYEPVTWFFRQLKRLPQDVPPEIDRKKTGFLTGMGMQFEWWFRERFIKDNFGSTWSLPKEAPAAPPATPPAEAAGAPAPTAAAATTSTEPTSFWGWLTATLSGHAPPAKEGVNRIPWGMWFWPMVNWTIFTLLVIAFLVCLAEVLRRVWLQVENLPMPLVEVPEGMLSLLPGSPNRTTGYASLLLVLGVVIGAGYFSLLAAQNYKLTGFDKLPSFYRIDLGPALADPPWKYIGGSQLWLSPLLIAIGCLVSLEVSRSIWSVYGIVVVALVVLGMAGVSEQTVTAPQQVFKFNFHNSYPLWDDQAAGALAAMGLWSLWTSRQGLWLIFRELWQPLDTKWLGEAYVPRRLLPVLLVALLVGMPAYAWFMGVTSFGFLLLLFGLFILFTVAAARLRAETGFMIVPAMPTMHRYTTMLAGARLFGPAASVVGNSFFFLSNSLISTLLPGQLEVIALAQRNRVSLKRLAGSVMLAAIVALAVGMPLAVFWQYSSPNGMGDMGSGGGKDSMYIFYRFAGKGLDQGQFETVRIVATAVGAAIMLSLLLARNFVIGFPIHPIGFLAVAATFGAGVPYNPQSRVNIIWGPMLIAWLLKSAIFKIGGTELFSRMLPVFRGVILGHLVAMVLWAFLRLYIDPAATMFFTW